MRISYKKLPGVILLAAVSFMPGVAALPSVGEKSLSYEGQELMRATFGIRNGKVSFISISGAE